MKEYIKELSLVVLGVLIALGVDNFREKKRVENLIDAYLEIVSDNLRFDIDTLTKQLKFDSLIFDKFTQLRKRLNTENFDSLDYYTGYLYQDSEYATRKTGYSMIINANLAYLIETETLKSLTEYYTTDSYDLEHWVSTDDKFQWSIIPLMTSYQDVFEQNAKTNKNFNINELKRSVIGRGGLLYLEMKCKLRIIHKAEGLLEQIGK